VADDAARDFRGNDAAEGRQLTMTGRVRLILTLHNHQPIGNFDSVFEAAYRDSYVPFLDVLDEFPDIPVVLHNSGSLLEWLIEHHPEYVDRLKLLVGAGRVEILGGPFYEPILSCLPRRDRVGQMVLFKRYLEQTFETRIRGMWVPERVWEQAFASDIAEAGLEYTLLDDFHFRHAGLKDDRLHGYYLTEDGGRLLKVFAGSERLRYLIPYQDPHETVRYCRQVADHHPHAVLIFGDDGEKFGAWPGSKDHVYRDGWLRRFFQALRDNQDWLRVTTMAEAVDHVSPLGRVYLPDASYREMTEWALPAGDQVAYQQMRHGLEHHSDWPRLRQFLRAGTWRNFLVKYPEVNEMYARMLEISRRLAAWDLGPSGRDDGEAEAARRALYRGQCNCPYWHGAFGGLYLPHLRNAVYRELIGADSLLEAAADRPRQWVHIEADDYNLDARKELRLSGQKLVAYLSPGRGGHLYELDARSIRVNLLATLNRRFEPYHERIRECAALAFHSAHGGGVDPNGGIRFKQPDLDRKLAYDHWPRKSLVDHFLQPGLSHEGFRDGHGRLGDFTEGVYHAVMRRSDEQVEARLWRDGALGPYQVRVTKTVSLSAAAGSMLVIGYELERLPAGLPIHFGVEFNFAALPAGAPDRFFYDEQGRRLGTLETLHDRRSQSRIGLVDEWLGLDVSLDFSAPASVWTQPIQTVSQSEGGFELVHQSVSLTPHWEFVAPGDGRWSVQITLTLDTSAAQARQLAESPPRKQLQPTTGG
jgi:alpha-amylase